MPSIPEQLDALSVADDLQRTESPLATGWAILTGYKEIGAVTTVGWRAVTAFGTGEESLYAAGARYTTNAGLDTGEEGPAVKVQVNTEPGSIGGRYFSVNLRLGIANAYGVRAKFIDAGSGSGPYIVRVEDWVNGVRTVIAEVEGVEINPNGFVAMYVLGGKVFVWVKETEEAAWEEVASAEVEEGGAYIASFAAQGALDAAGNIGRYKNFAIGTIEPEAEVGPGLYVKVGEELKPVKLGIE